MISLGLEIKFRFPTESESWETLTPRQPRDPERQTRTQTETDIYKLCSSRCVRPLIRGLRFCVSGEDGSWIQRELDAGSCPRSAAALAEVAGQAWVTVTTAAVKSIWTWGAAETVLCDNSFGDCGVRFTHLLSPS